MQTALCLRFFIIWLAKSVVFLMQGNTLALLTDALALLTDALTLQGIVKLNSLQTNQMLY
ncbi:hypothetical protein A6V25_12755 [Nostoc sp. ATCC 53789]|nr:hypothetical protein A6V25_12755 [Nostoc sp. ATCC 53789]